MRGRLSDRAALWTVGLLATWGNWFLNLVVWEGLYFAHVVPLDALNYQLSVWPVLVDVLILMATMILTRQQLRQSDTQNRMIQALVEIVQGLHALTRSEAERDARMERLLEHLDALTRSDAKDLDEILAWVRRHQEADHDAGR
jgi:hypothetical protein